MSARLFHCCELQNLRGSSSRQTSSFPCKSIIVSSFLRFFVSSERHHLRSSFTSRTSDARRASNTPHLWGLITSNSRAPPLIRRDGSSPTEGWERQRNCFGARHKARQPRVNRLQRSFTCFDTRPGWVAWCVLAMTCFFVQKTTTVESRSVEAIAPCQKTTTDKQRAATIGFQQSSCEIRFINAHNVKPSSEYP